MNNNAVFKLIGCASLVTLTSIFFACQSPGGSTSDVTNGSAGGLKITGEYSYRAQGNILTRTSITINYECDSLQHLQNFRDTSTDSISYVLKGDSLNLYPQNDSLDYTPSIVQFSDLYIRVPSGSGLQGTWKYNGQTYKLLSGTLTNSQKGDLNSGIQSENAWLYYETDQFQIKADSLIYYRDALTAREFLDEWNGTIYEDTIPSGDSSLGMYYNISVILMDQYTIKMTGNVTHEVVMRSQYGDNSGTITSDNPQHTAIHIAAFNYSGPTSCPDTSSASFDWYQSFLTDNAYPGYSSNKKSVLSKRNEILTGKDLRDPYKRRHMFFPLHKAR